MSEPALNEQVRAQESKHLGLRNRGILLVLIFVALSAIFVWASTIAIPMQQAQTLANQTRGISVTTPTIFFNNVRIALIEFIPVLGPLFAAFVSYSTGIATSALAETTPGAQISGLVASLALAITPIYWMEFFCYSLAVEESIAILISFRNHDFRKNEYRWLIGSIIVVVCVLLVSARIEVEFVNFFGQ